MCELSDRIVELEKRVRDLEARPIYMPVPVPMYAPTPVYPYPLAPNPNIPYYPMQPFCGANGAGEKQ